MTDPYADIRPYRDGEVLDVLQRLLRDSELLDALARLRLGNWARLVAPLARTLIRQRLRREVSDVSDVYSMQMVIKSYMDRMIEDTTSGLSVSGLDQLDPQRAYLYVSNHRDIAMDPAFTNYALHRGGHDTVRIAIGDNLLTKPWVSDLMRLNKSFIVKRSVSGPRELLKASKLLSAYIRHSLQEEQVSVWIAQREGRAKDGLDRTEPAIIKMLAMSRDKGECEFGEHIAALGIVPVAISYELDPCDALKAKEIHQLESTGSYEKAEQEDVLSIGQGITGDKGQVHVTFGSPLGPGLDTPEAVAAAIDEQVNKGYCLHPTNLFAHRKLHGEDAPVPEDLYMEDGACSQAQFEARMESLPVEHRPFALAIYANAVQTKLAGNSLSQER